MGLFHYFYIYDWVSNVGFNILYICFNENAKGLKVNFYRKFSKWKILLFLILEFAND